MQQEGEEKNEEQTEKKITDEEFKKGEAEDKRERKKAKER